MADFAKQAKAQNVNIVSKFEANLAELLAVLGKSDVSVMAPGTAMNIYKSSGELKSEQVAEGAEIAASTHKMSLSKTVELTYAKYRKITGIESIGKLGYDVAVLGSNEAMLRDVQKAVRKSIYDGIKTGTGATECAAGSTLQQQVAAAWGAMQAKFEDEAATPVFFASPVDVAGYLGAANITTQTAFGMSYLKDLRPNLLPGVPRPGVQGDRLRVLRARPTGGGRHGGVCRCVRPGVPLARPDGLRARPRRGAAARRGRNHRGRPARRAGAGPRQVVRGGRGPAPVAGPRAARALVDGGGGDPCRRLTIVANATIPPVAPVTDVVLFKANTDFVRKPDLAKPVCA